MAKTESKELAVIGPEVFNLTTIQQGSSDVTDNLDQIQIRLPQVKIIHQAQMFEMPDGSKTQSFEGIILDFNKINSYWANSFDETGGGTPPDCFSLDGVRPSMLSADLQANACPDCPKNIFGSERNKKGEPGRGKACKNLKRVHIITNSNQLLPFRLTLPPSNIKALDKYISDLAAMGKRWRQSWTEFKLVPQKNKDGIVYAELVMTHTKDIPWDQAIMAKDIAGKLFPILRDEVRQEEMAG